jgi:hypothetical protein
MGTMEELEDWGVGAEEKLPGDSPMNWKVGVLAETGDSDDSKSLWEREVSLKLRRLLERYELVKDI